MLRRQADIAPYGPTDAGVELVQGFGVLELEYAALRSNCVLIDQPQRATIRITGSDRIDFLNRMLTQELKDLENGGLTSRASFWLNRKGRIDADVRVIGTPDAVFIDVDVHAKETFLKTLDAYLFAEDCAMLDVTNEFHRLKLAGPTSLDLLEIAAEGVTAGKAAHELGDRETCVITIAGAEVVVDRRDRLGVPEFGLLMPVGETDAVVKRLTEVGMAPESDAIGEEEAGSRMKADESPGSRIRLRLAGWHAFNIARIEAGIPMFFLDFGPDSLPGETGLIEERVSFTKGCYLGQEIVARMHSLGHPKQIVRAIKCTSGQGAQEGQGDQEEQGDQAFGAPEPVTGSPVFVDGRESGAVTSATISPMLGAQAICLASIRWDEAEPGMEVVIKCDGGEVTGVVQEKLRFV